MKIDYANVDAICLVLANERSMAVIDAVRRKFLGIWGTLSYNQYEHLFFHSEEDMLHYFIKNEIEDELFFWNGNPADVLVGACFCSDGSLVMSVTMNANGESEFKTLQQLKTLLHSEIGAVSYSVYPEFTDKTEFISLIPGLACQPLGTK